jgi:alanine transaminase
MDIVNAFQTWIQGSIKDDRACRLIFDKIDLDGSGAISPDELGAVFDSLDEPVDKHEVASLMARMDLNHDGKIDYDEFKAFILRLTSFDKYHNDRDLQEAFDKWWSGQGIEEPAPQMSDDEKAGKVLLPTNINPCVRKVRYAVRGELLMLAEQLAEELRQGQKKSFDKVLFCNIGNPQGVDQPPISFYREVLALCDYPALIGRSGADKLFSSDALKRAKQINKSIPGGTGAYSHSQGVVSIRRDVADFIAKRDGFPAFAEDIFLTNGASSGIALMFQVMLGHPEDAMLVPIPQYPIYTALTELADGKTSDYYLDEDSGWSLKTSELQKALDKARKKGLNPRGLVVINPGNPTGQCFSRQVLEEVVRFCKKNRLVLLADEVYQANIYTQKEFISLKQVVRELGNSFDDLELISFHSTSKGLIGECGRRGGYMEVCGIHPEVRAEMIKLASIYLCPNLDGQVMTQLMTTPPQEGDPSYEDFKNEQNAIFSSLQKKAAMVHRAMNKLDGVSCQLLEGAMYAFPRISLPAGVLSEAETEGIAPDMHYCRSLLQSTGVCTVPGSGFGQQS